MAWNEPGNKGDDRDPWGNKNKDQGPPDLDEVFSKLSRMLGGFFGKKSSGSSGSSGSGRSPMSSVGIVMVLALALVVWVISGFYTVKEAELGVVLRFGAFVENVEPGLRWKPTFIDEVTPVDVETIRSLPAAGFMLTEDENIVHVELDVQYRVLEPKKYLYSVTNADDSLRQATDSALRFVIGHTIMDDILTTGREQVRQDTWDMIDKIIEPYDMGVSVIDVNFLPARAPEEVKDAFDDAISAQEDEQRYIREAEAYKREIEPRARGQVQRLEQEAQAYKEQAILRAQGEVARFEKLLPEYEAAPEVTRHRLYFETMERIYAKANKVLIDTDSSGNLLYLPIDKLMKSSTLSSTEVTPIGTNYSSTGSLQQSVSESSSPTTLRTSDRYGRD